MVFNVALAGIDLTEDNFVYVGAFRVPQGEQGDNKFECNANVNAQYQPMAYNRKNHSIFFGQKTQPETTAKRLGELKIPTIVNPADVSYVVGSLNTATVIQNIVDISDGDFDKLRLNGDIPEDVAKGQLGGLLVHNGTLYGTVWAYYDSSGNNGRRSHWSANTDWTGGYNFSGLHTVGTTPAPDWCAANGGFVGGYMCEIPDEYISTFDAYILTGRTSGPIASRSSYGPTFWTLDPADLDGDNAATSTMLIGYTEDHKTIGEYNDGPSLYVNRSTGTRGILWPKGSDTIFVFGNHGYGIDMDNDGAPVTLVNTCTGPGTSDRNEVKTNAWLLANSPGGWDCGYTSMSAADITGGDDCCFDPVDPSDTNHAYNYIPGVGEACYGVGTSDYTIARTNAWLVANSPDGYDCNGLSISAQDITNGNGCCFVGTGSTAKGGSSYPTVYQVYQYDVDDLINVYNSAANAYDFTPTIWQFDLPHDNPAKKKNFLGLAYDKVEQRFYIGQAFSDDNYPLIHVFDIINLTRSMSIETGATNPMSTGSTTSIQ